MHIICAEDCCIGITTFVVVIYSNVLACLCIFFWELFTTVRKTSFKSECCERWQVLHCISVGRNQGELWNYYFLGYVGLEHGVPSACLLDWTLHESYSAGLLNKQHNFPSSHFSWMVQDPHASHARNCDVESILLILLFLHRFYHGFNVDRFSPQWVVNLLLYRNLPLF